MVVVPGVMKKNNSGSKRRITKKLSISQLPAIVENIKSGSEGEAEETDSLEECSSIGS